jgi:hypothetical protein
MGQFKTKRRGAQSYAKWSRACEAALDAAAFGSPTLRHADPKTSVFSESSGRYLKAKF